ncbi:hypothetical protein GRX03_15975 [Halovenus sp. WSH3]|uniref:Uncharacterized protein n=1 Tax=Halovenus carboxidivorans TaxID=2692199 RepID=A0A6B0TA85_9EURY|nr:hypothetical protein [Halovenus carboxidivorans]MXR53096.1 hypothetical protein [Halovenus carboxidivorans]
MDPEEYFERVIRFLETKGWNTSTTQVNDTIYIVTGTRKSETYYDRMMAMVGVDAETAFGEGHLNYLVDAAAEHDVDQLMATCRSGVDEEASALLGEHGIEFIDPETIDDAFIDEFEVERPDGLFEQARTTGGGLAALGTDRFRSGLGSVLGLYLLSALLFGLTTGVVGVVGGASEPHPALLAAALVLVSPLLALVGALTLVAGDDGEPSPAGLFLGSVFGHILFVLLVGAAGGVGGLTAAAGLFGSVAGVLVVFALGIPAGAGAVGVAYVFIALDPDGEED